MFYLLRKPSLFTFVCSQAQNAKILSVFMVMKCVTTHTYIIIVYYKKEHCLTKDKYSEHIAQASIVMLIKSVVSPHKDATTWIFLELCQAQLMIY